MISMSTNNSLDEPSLPPLPGGRAPGSDELSGFIKRFLGNNEADIHALRRPLPTRKEWGWGEASRIQKSQRGISLIELIMFIVIVSVALAGILLVMNATTKNSTDPLVRKQALAIAESLLEEVELMPFTFCDPNDANAANAGAAAVGAGNCTTMVEGIGTEDDVSRYDATLPFDNVSDYHNFTMSPILDISGGATGVTGYTATITVVTQAFAGIAATEALLITVTVTGPGGVSVVEGMRTRYSPRAVP